MTRTNKDKKPLTEQVREVSRKPVEKKKVIDTKLLIPSGSLMLNLACSDNPYGAYPRGKMVNIIGDSSSGKTGLSLTGFAETNQIPEFDNYDMYLDDVEEANEFDLRYLFGKETAERIRPPLNGNSNTVQQWQNNIYKAVKGSRPFIYVTDSFDALTSDEELGRFEERLKNKVDKGSYKMEKPKAGSELLRVITGRLKETKSLLVIISQTRANIGLGFSPVTRSGGKALKFYASHEMWLAHLRAHKGKGIGKSDKVIGNDVRVRVTKNKITGKIREVGFSFFYDYGVDSLKDGIEWLVAEGHWKKPPKSSIITAPEFDFEGTQKSIIQMIEDGRKEKRLFSLVGDVWNKIENSLKLNRKRKYK